MILLTRELPKFRLIEAWLKHGYQEVTGWEHGEMLVKRYKRSVIKYMSHGDKMYSMGNIVNYTLICL